jgi:hypothetical protein
VAGSSEHSNKPTVNVGNFWNLRNSRLFKNDSAAKLIIPSITFKEIMINTFKIMIFVSTLRCKQINTMKFIYYVVAGCLESSTSKIWSRRVTAELLHTVLVSSQVNATLKSYSIRGAKMILFWPIRSVAARLLGFRMTQNGVEAPQKKKKNMAEQNIPVCGLLCVWCRPVEPHKPVEISITVFSTSSLIIPTVV